MLKDFQLQINNPPNGVYFPASTIIGTLLLTDTVHYTSHEAYMYLDLVAVVWDKNQHGSGGKLPPGSLAVRVCLAGT